MSDLNTTTTEVEADIKLTLISLEGDRFVLSKKAALMSDLIRVMTDADPTETEIPFPHIRSSLLDRVVKFLKHHVDVPCREIEKPLRSTILSEVIDSWDADLVEIPMEQLFELLMVSNYLHIKPLIDIASAKLAALFKNKTSDQIRKALFLTNDFTEEERKAVMAENRLSDDV